MILCAQKNALKILEVMRVERLGPGKGVRNDTFKYFFFILNTTFPLTLINISLKPEFGKLLIEKVFAYLAYLGGCKETISN